ncbi:MAG: hypothetical protein K2H70_04650, partial [Bacteroidales bacterium]|nr:hypothetical protein [Bacteroidales bacterium]
FVFDGTLTLTMTPVVNGVWMTDQAYPQTYTPDVKGVPDTIAVPLRSDTVMVTAVYDYTALCEDEERQAYADDTLLLSTFGRLKGHVIEADQMILKGEVPAMLRGHLDEPVRADYRYGWIAYTEDPATGAAGVIVSTDSAFTPAAADTTLFYRRTILYGSGLCADTSNTIQVIVRDILHISPVIDTVCAGSPANLMFDDTTGLIDWYLIYSVDGTFDTTGGGMAQKVTGSEHRLPVTVYDSGYYTFIGISRIDGRLFYGDTACVSHQPRIGNNWIGFEGKTFDETDTIVCPGQSVNLYGSQPTGGTGTYEYVYYRRTASGAYEPVTDWPVAAASAPARKAARAAAPAARAAAVDPAEPYNSGA